eukprot:CAMPEP_0174986318 /NCGR_PEP_ID=MMETSP0004_2-20121128/18871_1 /TAXON_ID=420556 /ORGANISM="Ochromonas sp., Strain CCMP1393" /LENGTH=191 /DNA_ID=CAMNT_0016239145 /DNA_START=167 /DNA_END=742 /DNA_ORIENTATION=-
MFFLDRKELLRNIVRSKVPRNRPLIRALSKRAAVTLLSKQIVEKVASNLCGVIPEVLGRMGIKADVNIIYTKAAFVCLEVSMTQVDIPQLILYNAGEEASLKIKALLEKISFPKLDDIINQFLLGFFVRKLMDRLPTMLKQKLQDKMYADVELVACSEEDLGPFLAQTIYQLNISSRYLGTVNESTPEKRH